MSALVLTNAYVSINGVDLSDHVRQIKFPYSADAVEAAAMGDTTKINLAGLKDWSVDVTFKQDFASNKVDATMFSIVGTAVTVAIRPVNASASATNPEYTGSGLCTSYAPVDGQHGALLETSAAFKPAGALSRATS